MRLVLVVVAFWYTQRLGFPWLHMAGRHQPLAAVWVVSGMLLLLMMMLLLLWLQLWLQLLVVVDPIPSRC